MRPILLLLAACGDGKPVEGFLVAPTVAFVSPADGDRVALGDGVTFVVEVSGQDATLTWEGVEGPATGVGELSVEATAAEVGAWDVAVVVTDADAQTARAAITLGVVDPDGDGDGARAAEWGGDDCDDADATAFPGGTEVCGGGDEDCDGLVDDDDDPVSGQVARFRDTDGDGWGGEAGLACEQADGWVEAEGDCDDADGAVNPDAAEACGGADEDCDGLVDDADEAPTGTTAWYADADADGYGVEPAVWACAAPAGTVAAAGDCDDSTRLVSPAELETCNGVDDDCDALVDADDDSLLATGRWYLDLDGDGHGDPATGVATCEALSGRVDVGDDCDDADASISPDATDTCDDGVDQDCDGADLACPVSGDVVLSAADLTYLGESASHLVGGSVAGPGDVDGDGLDDVWIAAQGDDGGGSSAGAAFLFVGGLDGGVSTATATLQGRDSWTYLSVVGPAGDVDGDGLADLIAGAYYDSGAANHAGAAFVLLGPVTGTVGGDSADAVLEGADRDDLAGSAVWTAGDQDGDGGADVLVGAPDGGTGGVVYLALGPTGLVGLGSAIAIDGLASGDSLGSAVAGGEDVDGDGVADLLLGAPDADHAATDAGAVYLLLGPVSAPDLSLADARFDGAAASDNLGGALALPGDLDGDGLTDVAVGAEEATIYAGRAYVFYGAPTGALSASAADAVLSGEDYGDRAGCSLAGAGDVDGDGIDDLLVGGSGSDANGRDAGVAWLLAGAPSGAVSLADADARLVGGVLGDEAGGAVAGAGDVDGDGSPDLLVGAVYNDDGGTSAGAAYLVHGR